MLFYLSCLTILGVSIACFYVPVPLTLNILLHSTLLIVIGCINSIKFLIREKISKVDFRDDDPIVEAVGMKEAYKFPIIGSIMLFTLYILVKYCGKEAVSLFLIVYFMFIGMESFKGILNNYTSIGKSRANDPGSIKYPILLKDVSVLGYDISISKFDLVCLLCSIACALFYVYTKHWTTNNFLGIIFTLFALENMLLGSFQVGVLMLFGLFFYDIFWVFGTDVMETVAKSIDGPIKLLFPKKPIIESNSDMSLLGLGDIVIPGIFIALCLRYDFISRFDKKTKDRSFEKVYEFFNSIPKPYFWSCIVGYITGMVTTVLIMLIFKRGQPALLYLVPGCVGSVLICAFVRREVKKVYHYNEDEELEQIVEETKRQLKGKEDKEPKLEKAETKKTK